MKVTGLVAHRLEEQPGTSAVLVSPEGRFFIEADGPIDTTLTPWVPLLTPIAMKRCGELRLEGPVARTAADASRAAQAVLAGWYTDLAEVDVSAEWHEPEPSGDGVGLFFSGGVDSFYSLLEHRDHVSHLVFVAGFDMGLHKAWLADRTLQALRQVAAETGVRLLTARTNIRQLSNRYCSWGRQYHGAAMAGIAHLFSPVIGTAIIPSSLSHPWGSDPELDPLWSSTVRIVHDTPLGRFDKLARIAESDLALRHLRVCYRARPGEYNCGRCEKCLRTMTSLCALGALERARTFPDTLDHRAIGRLRLWGGRTDFARENLAGLKRMPERDRRVERALARAIRRAPVRVAVHEWRAEARLRRDKAAKAVRRARRRVARRLAPIRRGQLGQS